MGISMFGDEGGLEKGRADRATISLDCEVRQGARPWRTVCLEDISPTGFRISWFPNCRPEIPLRIRIPGLELLTANVRWRQDFLVGCEFAAPLHVAVFDYLVKRAGDSR